MLMGLEKNAEEL